MMNYGYDGYDELHFNIFCIQFANIFLKSFTSRFTRAVGLQLYFVAVHFFFPSDFGIRVMLTSEISWEVFLPIAF